VQINQVNQQAHNDQMLIQDQRYRHESQSMNQIDQIQKSVYQNDSPKSSEVPNDLFDDDQKYYESVSVDLEQEEFNKL